MTFFKMLLSGLFLTVLGPSTTWACEAVLRTSALQIEHARLTLMDGRQEVGGFIDENLIFPILGNKGNFWAVIFDPDTDHKNEGYLIQGVKRGNQFVAMTVSHSSRDDEKDYLKAVAKMHNLKDQILTVKGDRILVQGWIEAKLWLKHHLKISEVRAILEARKGPKIYERGKRDPYVLTYGLDARGRSIKIIVAEEKNGPHVLVTAFTEAERHGTVH